MAQNTWMPQGFQAPRRGRGWLHVLWVGFVLFLVTALVLLLTGNPNLFPTVILIGNFLIPVVFVVFLYDHQHLSSLSPEIITKSFIVGGVLGVLGASVLEGLLLPLISGSGSDQGLSLTGGLGVGLIEEGCKILAVMFLARRMKHTEAIDGLLLGAAVGMGFAALESTGYAFTTFLVSKGHVGASLFTTVLRGLFAPFGHGVWTAILSAVLFRQSTPNRFRITGLVLLTYLFVSLLHGLWDGLPNTVYLIVPPGIPIPLISLVIGLIGIVVLTVQYRRARVQRTPLPPFIHT
jgi:RsiW-degrading membrane proteinase PrsW (M82 family)